MRKLLLIPFLLLSFIVSSQKTSESLTQELKWRNIGPANMMGRIAAIEALNSDYRHVLVASASGGVFKSTNAGIKWESIFDEYGAGSIGSIALFQPNPDIIWVGTGESANRNSSGWGDGIYVSLDGGRSFDNVGLEETHQIAEIQTHPSDPDVVYAAAIGHLWGYGGDRGLFKTTNGGKTWQKLGGGLPNDGKTGCTEIIMHPENPDILFAGFYHRLRQPATFHSGGDNGGLFKSEDAGKTWRKITEGLATGPSGQIDISFNLVNPDIMVMAYEADENIEEGQPGTGVYRSDDGGETWNFLLKHAVRPFYHGQIEIDPINPDNIYVVGRDFRISTDGGKSFQQRRWYTDGGDDHDMWIAPYDNKIMYLATDQGARLSVDGGKNWLSYNNMAIGQYYAIGLDMRDPYWVIGGLQDNGLWITPSNSREFRGILNEHISHVGEGDGFHAQIDPSDWKTHYLVNHVGFAVRQNIETRERKYITPTPETISNFSDWVDPNFDETPNKYTIDPGEHWFFYERADRPTLPAQFRFNWSSPLVMSPNNPNNIYFGGNHLFKSTDQGDSWEIISPDLTTNDPELRNTSNGGGLTNSNTGGENHFTIITISVSPFDENVIWIGTDDGLVHVTTNGGKKWTNVKTNIPDAPEKIWVSRVEAGHHNEGTAYVTLDNHRYDDNKPYVYKTDNFGETWSNISSDLDEKYSAYVIKEDPVAENLLFLGTEETVNVSIDGGATWANMRAGLPTVAVHDLVVHPREGDLVAGTHGRSLWIMDDVSPLRQFSSAVAQKDLHLFDTKTATKWFGLFTGRKQPAFMFRGENPPKGSLINFYAQQQVADSVTVTIIDQKTNRSIEWKTHAKPGINRTVWNFMLKRSKDEITSYKRQQNQVLDELTKVVKDASRKEVLATLKEDLAKAKSARDISSVRKKIITNFNMYGTGEPFFGEKMNDHVVADPGTYDIKIQFGNMVEEGTLKVREDPLRTK